MKIKIIYLLFFLAILEQRVSSQTISSGGNHALAICNDNTIMTWGVNTYFQLGTTSLPNSNLPISIPSLSNVKMVSSGGYHSLALKNDGTVWAWGNNLHGQLGNGTIVDNSTPAIVPSLSNVKKIVAGGNAFSMALKNDGTLWAWGNNEDGQLGDGSITNKLTPVQIISNVIDIAAGHNHTIVLKSDSTIWVWGNNSYGQLGINSTINSIIPIQVIGFNNIRSIAAGSMYSFAIKNNGDVYSWGENSYGQLGLGDTTKRIVPTQINSISNVIKIKGGNGHTLAITADSILWAWGNKVYGQLGDGTTSSTSTCWCEKNPIQITAMTGATQIEAGSASSFASKSDGILWAWGANYNGELGDGTYAEKRFPVKVVELCTLVAIEENSNDINFTIYPNPSNGKYLIKLNRFFKGTIEIYNLVGQKVSSVELTSDSTEIDITNLEPGVYLVRIGNEKESITKKVIQY